MKCSYYSTRCKKISLDLIPEIALFVKDKEVSACPLLAHCQFHISCFDCCWLWVLQVFPFSWFWAMQWSSLVVFWYLMYHWGICHWWVRFSPSSYSFFWVLGTPWFHHSNKFNILSVNLYHHLPLHLNHKEIYLIHRCHFLDQYWYQS